MRDLVIRFYKQGLYKATDLPVFVRVAWISKEDYKDLTGKEYSTEQ